MTFLFTDVEQSTFLWETEPERMADALATHDRILTESISRHDGEVFSTAGDAFAAAFVDPAAAIAAAESAQRELAASTDDLVLSVRMGIHSGTAEARGGDYFARR
ncbi:MAG: adenylate/guanylate cyclase domain-containing protein [Actinomycetota bacterium]|nr:adenylate/guanylate cyclase domain-containing protein [Actinomycetota bacterium]